MSSAPNRKPTTGLSVSIGLSVYYATFFLVGYLGIFAVGDFFLRRSIAAGERELVSERLSEYRAWYLSGQLQGLRSRFGEQSQRATELVFVHIATPSGSMMLYSSPGGQELIGADQLRELAAGDEAVVATLKTESPRNLWTVASSPLPGGGSLQAGRISTAAFASAERFRRFFLWGIFPVGLLALTGGALLSYRAMKPARELVATAAEIIETGQLDTRVAGGGSRGDLEAMGVLFNEMLDRNQGLIRAMRESLDNVAHDLRTPMARMRARAETALAKPGDAELAGEALGGCLEESERMLKMLDTLMDVAEAESGVMELELSRFDLVPLVDKLVEVYGLVAEERGITISTELPESLELVADEGRLGQAVANLIDNAIKYGCEGGSVRIAAARDAGEVAIRVADDGAGIDTADLPRIFERLYRGDRSRSERGLGLGLSFVRAIAGAHGGGVSVRSEVGGGSEFELRLPVEGGSLPT